MIAQEEAAVGAGQFQSFDFNRDQINLPGEAGTGRLQVRLEVEVQYREVKYYTITLKNARFAEALEIIDNNTGETRAMISQKPKEIVVVGSK